LLTHTRALSSLASASIVGTCTNYFTTEEKAKDIEVTLSSTSLSLSLTLTS
jgi:hypothetical protein